MDMINMLRKKDATQGNCKCTIVGESFWLPSCRRSYATFAKILVMLMIVLFLSVLLNGLDESGIFVLVIAGAYVLPWVTFEIVTKYAMMIHLSVVVARQLAIEKHTPEKEFELREAMTAMISVNAFDNGNAMLREVYDEYHEFTKSSPTAI